MHRQLSFLRAFPVFFLAVLALTLGALPARAGAATPWSVISDRTGGATDAPAVLRGTDGRLHVAWRDTDGATSGLRYRVQSPLGKWTATTAITSGWSSITNPGLTVVDNQLVAVWAGTAGAAPEPRSTGRAWFAVLTDKGWISPAEGFTESGAPTNSGSISAAVTRDGTPWTIWNGGAGTFGAHASFLRAGTEQSLAQPGCCQDHANVARDVKTGDVQAVYHSNEPGNSGIFRRRLAPEAGAPVRLVGGGTSAAGVLRHARMSIAARTSGGIYTAYCDTSSCARIRVTGTDGKTLTIVHPGTRPVAVDSVGVSPAPNGRLWVHWGDGSSMWAARSNTAFTKWGATVKLGLPIGTKGSPWYAAADGTKGSLDIIANITAGTSLRLWHRRALPGLSVTGKTTILPSSRLRKVTLTIHDAGVGVRGLVRFAGVEHTTNATGVATFIVSSAKRPGRYAVSGSAAGFSPIASTYALRG
ncbi:MAG: hypothetical protein JWM90_727 [Thermoleophilia bacterium]|nr:hypothetical protein [Thermoleophilia bacterium]